MQNILGGFRPWLILTALCSILYLPGLASLPVTDRDEARFMQATRQMVESGDYVVVRFQEELRAKKPVGIYWLQAASVRAFSDAASRAAWPYRLPSLLGAVATVLLVFLFGTLLFDRRMAFVAAAIMASTLTLAVESHLATTDAVLAALTTATMGALGTVYVRTRAGAAAPAWSPFVFWLGIGAGILIKGPVTPAVAIVCVVTLGTADRRWRWLRGLHPLTGMILCLLVVAPWMVAVTRRTGGLFLSRALQEDVLPKLLGGQEGHGAPPGYYLLLAGLLLWPGSLLLWPALWRAWRERGRPAVRFLLAWAVPSWLMFELVPTKLPHYVLPAFPALALMIATAQPAARDGSDAALMRPWPRSRRASSAAFGQPCLPLAPSAKPR